ncbi:MAG: MetQ/NlpA family ABC transporter substrate-binding protein [Rickettsiales bacterium]|jgi:D-methionine transport system substrate-binding protein|nr:MetQ/NlpA family ABC transporter substrate-binding protein [Rickettsiales bacterium]
MNKYLVYVLTLFFGVVSLVFGEKLKVGVSPVPHGEILEVIKDDLKKQGVELEIVEYADYVTPNLSLDDKSIDANYFQHKPYLDSFVASRNLKHKLIALPPVHVEPIALYSKKVKSIKELKNGAKIAIPNDPSNEGRSLILLAESGLIKLDKKAGLLGTPKNITSNPKNLQFSEIDVALLPRVINDFDAVIINGNYALESGYNPVKDSILIEGTKSPYANFVTVRADDKEKPSIKKLNDSLRSKKVKDFIAKKYNGGVVAAF